MAKTIKTAEPFKSRFVKYENAIVHEHDNSSHSHEGLDGHTWLDPINAIEQAKQILIALEKKAINNEQKVLLQKNFKSLEIKLKALDQRFKKLIPLLGNTKLLTSHPAYNYISQRYGLKITNFDFNPEEPLKKNDLESLAQIAKSHKSKTLLLWESMPSDETINSLKKAKVFSVLFSPCETLGQEEKEAELNYIKIMNQNLDRLENIL